MYPKCMPNVPQMYSAQPLISLSSHNTMQYVTFMWRICIPLRCYFLPGTFTHYPQIEMSLQSWQDVFSAKGLDNCTKNVKDADVARWTAGGLTPEDLPEYLDMVLEDAETRKEFASSNMMLGAKLSKAAVKTQPQVKNEAIVGLGQEEAGYGADCDDPVRPCQPG